MKGDDLKKIEESLSNDSEFDKSVFDYDLSFLNSNDDYPIEDDDNYFEEEDY